MSEEDNKPEGEKKPTGKYYLNDEFLSAEDADESESDVLIIDECIRSEKVPSPKKEEAPPETTSFGPVETDDKKFEQVENELEALFAGVESDEGKSGGGVDQVVGTAAPKNEEEPTKPKTTKTTRPYKKRAEKPPQSSSKPIKSTKLKRKKTGTEQERLLEKYKGPFLRVHGPDPLNPLWSNIINFAGDALSPEAEARLWASSSLDGIPEREHTGRMAGITYSALLASSSAYYDENWVCVFCKNRSHHQGLGDLFGPYYIPSELLKDFSVPKKSKPSELASKFILGGSEPNAKKRKRKKAGQQEAANHSAESNNSNTASHPNQSEVWMHEDCICWIQDVQILGHRLLGLERAIEESNKTKCAICSLNGCSFGCSSLGCRRVAHYPCALMSKWTLNEDEFQAFCLDHRPGA